MKTCLKKWALIAGVFAMVASAQTAAIPEADDDAGSGSGSGGPFAAAPLVAPTKSTGPDLHLPDCGVNWLALSGQSLEFLAVEHAFRYTMEPGTRAGMKGPFFRSYLDAVGSLHGWADGDPFYVNYVGHPMMGATAGRIWQQNDRKYLGVEFGANRNYWKSTLRASAFSFLYSAQFEIGAVSEASVGKVQSVFPQQGMADFVVTPFVGMGWMIAEDALDKYVIRSLERRVRNGWARLLLRGGLNPTRSMANMLGGHPPWYRVNRAGVTFADSYTNRKLRVDADLETPNPPSGVAPFEFNMSLQPQIFPSAGISCLGGNGSAALRLAEEWQLVMDVGGCKMFGLDTNFSGDSLTYTIGPRWRPLAAARFNPYLQVLVGGQKVTQEQFFPEQAAKWEPAVRASENPAAYRDNYVKGDATNALAVAAGGGIDLKVNSALSVRLASIEFRHSWLRSMNGMDFHTGIQFSTGVVLQMGTW